MWCPGDDAPTVSVLRVVEEPSEGGDMYVIAADDRPTRCLSQGVGPKGLRDARLGTTGIVVIIVVIDLSFI